MCLSSILIKKKAAAADITKNKMACESSYVHGEDRIYKELFIIVIQR